ncbi:unnamed protein product [Nezara viridula]|uniref:Uncharacterized protein n=1 Tax=Nezara viridula TaxID=85310 RepID=A0A9P0E1Q4_NEZVI|nr:unnamed protein product [Nezara viridula]
MIPLQLTRPGQLSSGCKRPFQSLYLPRIGTQEALISTYQIIGFGLNWIRWNTTEHTLTWKASNRAVERFSQEVLRAAIDDWRR